MSKEPTRAQLSSRLAYQSQTPAFLLKLQRKVAGQQEDDEDEPQYEDWDDGSGRPPIPRRPAIPQRPDDDPGSADEDDGDEAPQIVVLKEGKHLSERDVENEKRKGEHSTAVCSTPLVSTQILAKGLPPLPDDKGKDKSKDATAAESKSGSKSSAKQQSLSFSSGGASTSAKKRKAVGDGKEDDQRDEKKKKAGAKKPKKAEKKLLSFDEDA